MLYLFQADGTMKAIKLPETASLAHVPAKTVTLEDFDERVLSGPRARLLARIAFRAHGLRMDLVTGHSRHLDVLASQAEPDAVVA